MKTYFYKLLYDDNNSVSGKFSRGYTGKDALKATAETISDELIKKHFLNSHSTAQNIRNIQVHTTGG